jgi:REP element-mobilizing transposase RayT
MLLLPKPARVHPRLKYYDYRAPGAYFVTICTQGRRAILGRIILGQFVPSALGALCVQKILEIPFHATVPVKIDIFQVMPNHIHLIVMILPDPQTHRGLEQIKVQPATGAVRQGGVEGSSLGAIVGSFKAAVTRAWKQIDPALAGSVWQAGFFEHIIRHEKALERIREYIVNNPQQWGLDRENALRTGDNPFYRWLDAYSIKTRPPAT